MRDPNAAQGQEGPEIAAQPDTFFQIVSMHKGRERPKLMKTLHTSTDVVLQGKIALHVQPFEAREPYNVASGRVGVHTANEPVWVDWSSLGSFDDICYRLSQFGSTENDPENSESLVLADRVPARPTIPLTDEKCPTLMIIWHLRAQGWAFVKKRCVHTLENADSLVLDGRNPIRSKLYYMTLLRLRRYLQQTSAIPSGQTQLFYRLLLAGKKVEPDLPLENYVQMCGGRGKVLPLPIPEEGVDIFPLPEPPVVDEDLVVAVAAPEPKARPSRAKKPELPLPKAKVAPAPPDPPPPPLPAPAPPPGEPGAGVEGAPGGGPVCPGGGGLLPPGPAPVAIPPVAFDPDLVVGVPALADEEPRQPKRRMKWKDAIGGGKVRYDQWEVQGVLKPNYKITCTVCPEWKGCKKSKADSEENRRKHGRIGPLAFVHAWRDISLLGVTKSHGRMDPTEEEVDRFAAAHRDELEELVDLCMADY